jgi:uncharacterized DUF497 family protein
MKRFRQLHWDEWNIEHLSTHEVIPEEVEEIAFSSRNRIRRGRNKSLYYLFGQSYAGRYLFVVVRDLGKGRAKPITARDMTNSERKLYREML